MIYQFIFTEKALIKPIQRLEPYTPISGRVKKEEGSLELISKSRRQEMLRNMTYTIDNYTKKTLPERLGQKRQHEPGLYLSFPFKTCKVAYALPLRLCYSGSVLTCILHG